ncbi:TonB-dependent siderophore receptor [Agrobacterium larrymoorei]|uniref:TonB-dependent siderophore receptor n=1 Tax=Agrobacterium larrymoorei TaxID=160699 RepID=A0A4D7DXH0_9HYPH|nr:TonB-dependent siderophore receptor [Agrobacterium larrymoorei]QYA08225.1 TonB-dependent siderophore receptor [Agrobacterium larrymoorei]
MKKTNHILLTRLLTGTALLVLGVPHASFAQEAGTTVLEQITVQGAGDATGTGPVDGYVAKKSTSGSKSDTPLKEIPQSVSVIGREELDDRAVVTKVDEALRYTPGVLTQQFGVDADTDWFYLRGFDASQTGVFLDGLNLFSYAFGNFQIDAYSLERVEVLKGASSVIYGGANPGGIVQLTSKRPQDEPIRQTEVGINNFGNAFFGFDLGDKIDEEGVWKYRVTGKVAGGDTYTDYSNDLRGFIMPQISFEPDAQTSATVYGYFSALDQVHTGNSFLPYEGTVVNGSFGKISRDSFFSEPDMDKGRAYQSLVGYEISHEFDNGWKLSQNARYAYLNKHETGVFGNGLTAVGSDTLNRFASDEVSKVDSFNIDNRAEKEFETGALDHNLLLGLDYKHFQLDRVQRAGSADPINVVNPVYTGNYTLGSPYADELITQQQLGVYAQDRIRFGDGWLVTLNGRYDYVDTDVENRIGASRSSNDSALSGRAGLAYEFDNGLTPYVSASTFFNPLVDSLANGETAKPEEGHQFETGVKYEPDFFDGTLNASVFKLVKQNAIVSYTDSNNKFVSGQFGEVESQGVELEAKVNLNENWKALAAYSYTDIEITEDANPNLIGKSPWLIPNHTASLWLDYSFTNDTLEGLSLGGGVRFKGKSYADQLNQLEVPSAAVFDAAIRYEKNDWTASVNVANLFDKEYVAGCAGANVCAWGDSRTITFKLSKKW